VQVNGHADRRLPHLTNISFGFVEGESLLMGIKDIACSSGSACTSASSSRRYVLKSLGVGDELAHSRCGSRSAAGQPRPRSTSRSTSSSKAVNHLREMSPLYDLHKEGVDISKIEWQRTESKDAGSSRLRRR
jgi:cysteine desulfurase